MRGVGLGKVEELLRIVRLKAVEKQRGLVRLGHDVEGVQHGTMAADLLHAAGSVDAALEAAMTLWWTHASKRARAAMVKAARIGHGPGRSDQPRGVQKFFKYSGQPTVLGEAVLEVIPRLKNAMADGSSPSVTASSIAPRGGATRESIRGQGHGPGNRDNAEGDSALKAVPSKRVFIVHGHDEAAKQAVARFVEQLGLEAVILHERANKGRTVIEKFEEESHAGFAVVLLTPDDVGSSRGGEPRPRARQNVVLELGYFVGRLGRKHVCALLKGDLELPTDYSGILYKPFDEAGAWRTELLREFSAAQIKIDDARLMAALTGQAGGS